MIFSKKKKDVIDGPKKLGLIEKFFIKRALNKYLRKQIKEIRGLKKKLPDEKVKENLEREFKDSVIATEKILTYCREKKLKNKIDWDKAGIPMSYVVRSLMQTSVKYAAIRHKDAEEMNEP